MNEKPWKQIIDDLTERARELNCLYQIEELLSDTEADLDELLQKIVEIIPSGWQYAPLCRAHLSLEGRTFETEGFKGSRCCQSAPILREGEEIGRIVVCYAAEVGRGGERSAVAGAHGTRVRLLAPYAVDVALGHGHVFQKGEAGHAVVALPVLGGDAALVGPPHVHSPPQPLVVARQLGQ